MRTYLHGWLNPRTVVCASLAALVFFSRAWLAQIWGSPLPFWDQWDAEIIGLYHPWLEGSLRWADIFRAHNEHRIALTRLTDLVLFCVYGGWNPWAQLLLNAALHAITAATLAALFWPALVERSRLFFIFGITVIFTSACGWQNALYGFQSHVYFANLLTIIVIVGFCSDVAFSAKWWAGLLAAWLAFFSNGGGILAVMAAFIAQTVLAWSSPRTSRAWAAMAILGIASVLGIYMGSEAPQHAAFHAKTVRQFIEALANCMAWPWINFGAYCVIMQLPLVWLAVERWRKRTPLNAIERCAVALGLFAILQAAAIAHSRGGVLPESRPISRYHDPLLLGVAGQLFVAIQFLCGENRARRTFALVWCGFALAGIIRLTETNFTLHLPFKRVQDEANLAIVRDYAHTRDFAVFSRDPNFSGPHPDPHVVKRVIDNPEMRAVLPAAVLHSEKALDDGLPIIFRHSFLLTGISGAFLVVSLLFLWRNKSNRTHPTIPAQSSAR